MKMDINKANNMRGIERLFSRYVSPVSEVLLHDCKEFQKRKMLDSLSHFIIENVDDLPIEQREYVDEYSGGDVIEHEMIIISKERLKELLDCEKRMI